MIFLALFFAMQTDWPAALPAMGWTRAAESNEVVLFIKPGPRPNLRWQRHERRTVSSNGVRSMMSLVEVDCLGGRSRFIQGAYYGEPNLQGGSSADNVTTEWSYPLPGTVGADFFRAACE